MNGTVPYASRTRTPLARAMALAASRRSRLKIWWQEVDRVLLGLVLLLMSVGTIAVAAASPASANRLSTAETNLPELYFFWRHIAFQVVSVCALIGASFLPRLYARRAGIVLAIVMIGFLLLVPLVGHEVNGARRWIDFGIRFQPSAFLKPGFAILLAWMLSWRLRDPNLPVVALAIATSMLVVILLALQPNFGDAILFVGCAFVLLILSGVSIKMIGTFSGVGAGALMLTYFLYDNARNRIDAFLGGGSAFDQVDLAHRTLTAGGWTGSGLWLGLKKMSLPEAHTDYIFSVIGEEFGLVVCAIIVLLYLAIILRVLTRLAEEQDIFTILAASGLTAMFGGQAFVNIMVNLQLFPSKGMTLPLVSYGGSSTIAVCLTIGLLLAITRRNPFLQRNTPGLAQIFRDGDRREGVQ